ncbi:uncharacterized protein [Argopecten irradians]|uniref:uncharacterized protein n=1 Tax=Argopecten irradians TaxID=31199 RepID=UPI00371FF557
MTGYPDTTGTDFMVGFMSTVSHTDSSDSVELFISNPHADDVTINITSPKLTDIIGITVACGTVRRFSWAGYMRSESNSRKEYRGIRITSSREVVVSGSSVEYSSYDSFLILPTDVLGTNYYGVAFSPTATVGQLLVVGVQDDTTVTVTLDKNAFIYGYIKYNPGVELRLSLNQYEMFQIHGLDDISGTHIISDKRIAVFSGNKHTHIGRETQLTTHLVEQLIPVHTWGNTFVLAPIPNNYIDVYFHVVASQDRTQIRVTGDFDTYGYEEIAAGQAISFLFAYNHLGLLIANKPISVMEFSQGYAGFLSSVNPTMILIPPVEQYSTTYTFGTPSGSLSNYFVFFIRKADFDGLLFDGRDFPLSSYSLKTMTGSDFVTGKISVSSGPHSVRHRSPYVTFGAYLYGDLSGDKTYGFPVGMRMVDINSSCTKSDSIVGDGKDNDCDGRIDEELCNGNTTDTDGDGQFNEDCVEIPDVQGGWSPWSEYYTCSISCYDGTTYGSQMRLRRCTNPYPDTCDANYCPGSSLETRECPTNLRCPIDGEWSAWSAWGACSITCAVAEGGTKSRSRRCTNPVPQFDGDSCYGQATESLQCYLNEPCPDAGITTSTEVVSVVPTSTLSSADVPTISVDNDDITTTTDVSSDVAANRLTSSDVTTTTADVDDIISTSTTAAATSTVPASSVTFSGTPGIDISTSLMISADFGTTATFDLSLTQVITSPQDFDFTTASLGTSLFTHNTDSLSGSTPILTNTDVQQLQTTIDSASPYWVMSTQQYTPTLSSDYTPFSVTNVSATAECSCNWFPCETPGIEELRKMLEELNAELKISRNQTSRYKRSLSSANDHRTSAQATGYVGSLVLLGLGILIIIADRRNLQDMIGKMKRNLCRK